MVVIINESTEKLAFWENLYFPAYLSEKSPNSSIVENLGNKNFQQVVQAFNCRKAFFWCVIFTLLLAFL